MKSGFFSILYTLAFIKRVLPYFSSGYSSMTSTIILAPNLKLF